MLIRQLRSIDPRGKSCPRFTSWVNSFLREVFVQTWYMCAFFYMPIAVECALVLIFLKSAKPKYDTFLNKQKTKSLGFFFHLISY